VVLGRFGGFRSLLSYRCLSLSPRRLVPVYVGCRAHCPRSLDPPHHALFELLSVRTRSDTWSSKRKTPHCLGRLERIQCFVGGGSVDGIRALAVDEDRAFVLNPPWTLPGIALPSGTSNHTASRPRSRAMFPVSLPYGVLGASDSRRSFSASRSCPPGS
jgi:hypothetical protein